MSETEQVSTKLPSLFRNYISFVGSAIGAAALVSIVLLILVELTGRQESPYLGILTYIIFPSILTLGLIIVVIGMLIEKRRRHKGAPAEIARYPKLDLNDDKARQAFFVFLLGTFLFICASAFGSYKAYEYTESDAFCGETCHKVMKPEYTAYHAGAHARVGCVGCHVGPGAGWYVRSKLSGAYQLYSVTFNKYPRPITTPVHNLRPAPDTCEKCHWPEKFFGAQLKTFNHYAYDEKNSLRQMRMLINVGGGSPTTGAVAGIHWHMNIANTLEYISTDGQRQVIPWIRIKDRQGNVTEYVDRNRPLTAEQIATAEKRRMDCVDCHNRPAHTYLPPDVAVDQAFAAGRMDLSLPYLKRNAVEVLRKEYKTEDEAVKAIAQSMQDFYQTNYKDLYAQKTDAVKNAISETQRIFKTYFFPEMKVNWETHPNNIGHLYSSGCFRCHDGEHVSSTGKIIRTDCNICHTVLSDSARPSTTIGTVAIQHPVDLGALADRKCETCHKGDQPFRHPVNLGDISMFQCVECHPRKTQEAPKAH